MTTIAYKSGIVAYESYLTQDDAIIDYDCEKMVHVDDVVFFFAGNAHNEQTLIDGYFSGSPILVPSKAECDAIIVDGTDIYLAGLEESEFWKLPLEMNHYALGSGAMVAFGAMDAGASAKRAVEIACNRDVYSGGEVKTYRIK